LCTFMVVITCASRSRCLKMKKFKLHFCSYYLLNLILSVESPEIQ